MSLNNGRTASGTTTHSTIAAESPIEASPPATELAALLTPNRDDRGEALTQLISVIILMMKDEIGLGHCGYVIQMDLNVGAARRAARISVDDRIAPARYDRDGMGVQGRRD